MELAQALKMPVASGYPSVDRAGFYNIMQPLFIGR
jgi:hypothetical protein